MGSIVEIEGLPMNALFQAFAFFKPTLLPTNLEPHRGLPVRGVNVSSGGQYDKTTWKTIHFLGKELRSKGG